MWGRWGARGEAGGVEVTGELCTEEDGDEGG